MRNKCQGKWCKNTAKRGQRLCGKCKRQEHGREREASPPDESEEVYRNANANRLIVRKQDSESVEFHDRSRLLATWFGGTLSGSSAGVSASSSFRTCGARGCWCGISGGTGLRAIHRSGGGERWESYGGGWRGVGG